MKRVYQKIENNSIESIIKAGGMDQELG